MGFQSARIWCICRYRGTPSATVAGPSNTVSQRAPCSYSSKPMPLRATTAASNSASVSAMESIGPAVQTVSSSAKALFMVVLPCTAFRHLLHQPQGGQYTQQRTGNQGDNDRCPVAVELVDNKEHTHHPWCNEQYQHRNQTPTGLCQLITDLATQHQGKGGHHHPQHPATDRQTRQHPQRLTQQEEHHQNQKTPQQHHAAMHRLAEIALH